MASRCSPLLRGLTAAAATLGVLAGCGSGNADGGAVGEANGGAGAAVSTSSAVPSSVTPGSVNTGGEGLAADAAAKSAARNMVTDVESCFTTTQSYRPCVPGSPRLPTVPDALAKVKVAPDGASGYTVASPSSSGNVFRITRAARGSVQRSCTVKGSASCPPTGRW